MLKKAKSWVALTLTLLVIRTALCMAAVYIVDPFEHYRESAILPLYESRGIALAVQSEEFSLAVDPELFQSMLVNLLDNAAKASRPGQEVTLSALLQDGLPVVAVADQGIGIPPDKISQITEPFFMVDKARSRKSGGAGLGLALRSEERR